MRSCKACGSTLKSRERIGDKIINMATRRYCLQCSSYGNTWKKDRGSCKNCSKPLEKGQYHYCSRSCSATVANRIHPKRQKIKRVCKDCSGEYYNRSGRCPKCQLRINELRYASWSQITLGDIRFKNKIDANRYRLIRFHARYSMTKLCKKECSFCGYTTHVEVVHLKAISEHQDNDTVAVINHPSNLRYLCRNHHWEYDKGLLVFNGSCFCQSS